MNSIKNFSNPNFNGGLQFSLLKYLGKQITAKENPKFLRKSSYQQNPILLFM